jgi:hypothetical protein
MGTYMSNRPRRWRGDERATGRVRGGRARFFLVLLEISWPLSVPTCASLAFGLANGGPGWLLDFCFCPALTGVVHWPVLGGVAGLWRSIWYSLTQLRWGRGRCTRVMGACSAACPQHRFNHLSRNYDGVVGGAFRCGSSERRRGHLVGRVGGSGPRGHEVGSCGWVGGRVGGGGG